MLIDAALGFINHVLGNEVWARARFKPFSGQIVRLDLGKHDMAFEITSEGYFKPARLSSPPTVSLLLNTDSVLRSLTQRVPLSSDIQISGSARLAECLRAVFDKLHWDFENDLSLLLGDIAARRLVLGGKSLVNWQLTQLQALTRGAAEFLTGESPVLALSSDFAATYAETDQARKTLDLLENRVARLEK